MGEDALEERLRGATQVQAPKPYRLSRLIAVSRRQPSLSLELKRQPRLEADFYKSRRPVYPPPPPPPKKKRVSKL
jgi:hypothetical protein